MKRLLCGVCAAAMVASPAAARDRSTYFGLEVGPMWVKDTDIEVDNEDLFNVEHKLGIDGDMILGHDWGLFRLEAELGYKRSGHDKYSLDGESVSADGRTSTHSAMINGMVDFGNESQIAFYAGAGIGYAQVIHVAKVDDAFSFKIKDRGLAWQVVAGVRKTLTNFFDVGLKYRYFNGGNVNDRIDGDPVSTDYRTHSVLVSLIHNFNTPLPPPLPMVEVPPAPPPPPPPATQTCPDGSVILMTDNCPLPPAPPPPPPPTEERG